MPFYRPSFSHVLTFFIFLSLIVLAFIIYNNFIDKTLEPFDQTLLHSINHAWGIRKCEPLAGHLAALTEAAAITRMDYINNLRLRTEHVSGEESSDLCYLPLDDPVINGTDGCSIKNPLLNNSNVFKNVYLNAAPQHDSTFPTNRCVLQVQPNPSIADLESLWKSWGKTSCTSFTKPMRQAIEDQQAIYRTLYQQHQTTLSDINTTRASIDSNKIGLEACSAEDERLSIDLPNVSERRINCDKDLDKLRKQAFEFNDLCTSQLNNDKLTVEKHTNNLEGITKRIDVAAGAYRNASQDLNTKLDILKQTETHNLNVTRVNEELNDLIKNEWVPRRDKTRNTLDIKTRAFGTCSAERDTLNTLVIQEEAAFDSCTKNKVSCQTRLKNVKEIIGKKTTEFALLHTKERDLQQELLKLRALVALCDTRLGQCKTDKSTHEIELENLKSRLKMCLSGVDNDRDKYDSEENSKLTEMRSGIVQLVKEMGDTCKDTIPSAQPALVQGTNTPVGAGSISVRTNVPLTDATDYDISGIWRNPGVRLDVPVGQSGTGVWLNTSTGLSRRLHITFQRTGTNSYMVTFPDKPEESGAVTVSSANSICFSNGTCWSR